MTSLFGGIQHDSTISWLACVSACALFREISSSADTGGFPPPRESLNLHGDHKSGRMAFASRPSPASCTEIQLHHLTFLRRRAQEVKPQSRWEMKLEKPCKKWLLGSFYAHCKSKMESYGSPKKIDNFFIYCTIIITIITFTQLGSSSCSSSQHFPTPLDSPSSNRRTRPGTVDALPVGDSG
jgi:hypothetical protein